MASAVLNPLCVCPPASPHVVIPAALHLVSWQYHKLEEQDCLGHIRGAVEKLHFMWVNLEKLTQQPGGFFLS